MKKSTLKLALRRETLRVLAGRDLARVGGGNEGARLKGTGGPETGCPLIQLADSGNTGTGFAGAKA
jgi:hypothetical protein